MLVRNKAGQVHVLYDASKTEMLARNLENINETESKFSFLLYSKNQYFVNITDVPVDLSNKIFYCSNKNAGLKRSTSLHSGKYLGPENLYELAAQEIKDDEEDNIDYEIVQENAEKNDENSVTKIEPGRQVEVDKLIEGHYKIFGNDKELSSFINIGKKIKGSPIGYIEVFFHKKLKQKVIQEIEANELESFDYNLYFNARSVYWKYMIVPIYMKRLKKLNVEAQNGKGDISFKGLGNEEVNDKKVISFISDKPVQYRQYQDFEIQLKKKEGEGASKTLIKKMPYAPIDLIKPMDKENYMSEIFIYI
jgi:hypothetical protein